MIIMSLDCPDSSVVSLVPLCSELIVSLAQVSSESELWPSSDSYTTNISSEPKGIWKN
jgi:hypothetical protein